jgi:hypothetical protein
MASDYTKVAIGSTIGHEKVVKCPKCGRLALEMNLPSTGAKTYLHMVRTVVVDDVAYLQYDSCPPSILTPSKSPED